MSGESAQHLIQLVIGNAGLTNTIALVMIEVGELPNRTPEDTIELWKALNVALRQAKKWEAQR